MRLCDVTGDHSANTAGPLVAPPPTAIPACYQRQPSAGAGKERPGLVLTDDTLRQMHRWPVPAVPVIAVQGFMLSNADDHEVGPWAALLHPSAQPLGLAFVWNTAPTAGSAPSSVQFGLWECDQRAAYVTGAFDRVHRWRGPSLPVAIAAALDQGAVLIAPSLPATQVLWRINGWPEPSAWLTMPDLLASKNQHAEVPEVAAWLSGVPRSTLTWVDASEHDGKATSGSAKGEKKAVVTPHPQLGHMTYAWRALDRWTGITRMDPKKASIPALALARLALGVVARLGTALSGPLERQAVAADQVVNFAGIPLDLSYATTVVTMMQDLGVPVAANKINEVLIHAGPDGVVRGAYHYLDQVTGRWQARKPNVMNLRRIAKPDKALVRSLVADFSTGNIEAAKQRVAGRSATATADLLGQLERTIITAPPGFVFIVGDQKQAEPRCLFHLAGHRDYLELMDSTDIYLLDEFQDHLYGNAVASDHPEAGSRRDAVKITVIGCGYGMGAPTLRKYGIENFGLDLTAVGVDPERAVSFYRTTFCKVPRLWGNLGEGSLIGLIAHAPYEMPPVTFIRDGDAMAMRLPSGRCIWYPGAHRAEGRFGPVLGYWRGGLLDGTGAHLWGGNLVQHLVTGLMRDVQAGHLAALNATGFLVPVAHGHDEICCLCPADRAEEGVAVMARVMSTTPDYLAGCPLRCEPMITERLGMSGLKR